MQKNVLVFLLAACAMAAGGLCEVLGGTLPAGMKPEFYTDLIALARVRNIPVIFDAGEPNLSAGLKSKPSYIKPNRDELGGLVGRLAGLYGPGDAAGFVMSTLGAVALLFAYRKLRST